MCLCVRTGAGGGCTHTKGEKRRRGSELGGADTGALSALKGAPSLGGTGRAAYYAHTGQSSLISDFTSGYVLLTAHARDKRQTEVR